MNDKKLALLSHIGKPQGRRIKRYCKALKKGNLPIDALMRQQDAKQILDHELPDQMRIDFNEGGVYFGPDSFDDFSYFTGKHQKDDGHILVVGSPGCHKTTGIILPTILTWKGTFAAVDVKGDISDFCIRNRRKIAFPIAILDFASAETEVHFDPFLQLQKGGEAELISNARELALSIIPTPSNVKEPFWVQGAQNIFAAIILYAFGKGITFNQAIEMALTTPVEEIQKAILGSGNQAAKSFIAQYPENQSSESDDKALRGSFIEMANAIHDFFHPNVQKIFEANGYSLDLERDVRNSNIIIRIPESKLTQWGGAVRLILRQLFTALSNRPDKYSPLGRYLPPFLLLWDEMPRFGKFEDLGQAFSTLRSRGVTICAVIQSFAQLDQIYGPSARRVLVDCCSYVVIGRVQDVETQKYCAELVGTSPIWEPSIGESYHSGREEFTFSRSLNLGRKPILYPEDFATLEDFIVATPFGKFFVKKSPLFEKFAFPSCEYGSKKLISQKGRGFCDF